MKSIIGLLLLVSVLSSEEIISNKSIQDIVNGNEKIWIEYFEKKYSTQINTYDKAYIKDLNLRYKNVIVNRNGYIDRSIKNFKRTIDGFNQRTKNKYESDPLIKYLNTHVTYTNIADSYLKYNCSPLGPDCEKSIKKLNNNPNYKNEILLEKFAKDLKNQKYVDSQKPLNCSVLILNYSDLEKAEQCLNNRKKQLNDLNTKYSLKEKYKNSYASFKREIDKMSSKIEERKIYFEKKHDEDMHTYIYWGIGFLLLLFMLFLGDKAKQKRIAQEKIERERIAKEQAEIAKQKEIERLNSLPKCPSCNEPLDEINKTFTRTLKEKKVSNIK